MSVTEEQIAAIVTDVSSQARITAADFDRPLKDLGVDSLDVAGIFLAIYEQLGVRVPDPEIDRLNTIRLIVNYMNKNA
ncbi:MAG TPA: acyl carrier protein [Burkholderiales bacterium]|nr:acyl carrier protein [Burkholderiales bacterium]